MAAALHLAALERREARRAAARVRVHPLRGEVQEPEVDGLRRVAEQEVGLGDALGRCGRKLDRHRVREVGAGRSTLGSGSGRGRLAPEVAAGARARLGGGCGRGLWLAPDVGPPHRLGGRGRRELLVRERHLERRRVRGGGVGAHVVPAHLERDPLRVVDRPHLDGVRRRRERTARLHDLADHRKARARGAREEGSTLRGVDVVLERPRDDERGVVGHVRVAERVDVVGERPAVGLGHRVEERRHRRAVEAGAEGAEDVLALRPAAEGPAPRQIGSADRVVEVVLERRGRRALAAPGLAVAADAAERAVELLALGDRLLGRGRRRAERDRLRSLGGIREAGVEGLQVLHDAVQLGVGQLRPGRHRAIGHAQPDHPLQVFVRGQRPRGGRAQLELAAREVARPGRQVHRGGPLAVALLAVALDAVLLVDLLARLDRGPGSRDDRGRQDQPDEQHDERADAHQCSSLARGRWPVWS